MRAHDDAADVVGDMTEIDRPSMADDLALCAGPCESG